MTFTLRDSLAEIIERLEPKLASGGTDLAQQLFAALAVIDDNGALRRSLTDPTTEADRRQKLVAKVFGNQVSADATDVLETVAATRWPKERDLTDALEVIGVQVLAQAVERDGLAGLQSLVQQLLQFNALVEASHDAQRLLTDQQYPKNARGDLAEKLLREAAGANALVEAKVAVRQAIEHPRGAQPIDLVRKFADQIAARQSRWIADVTVAQPLSQSQQERLEKGLAASFGRDIALNLEVDPQLVGGIRVQVANEVVDSSIASLLNNLKTHLAG